MATITKTIGTSSRDYSTIQAWIDALPANLVTDGNSYVGDCYNDSEFTSTGALATFGAHTTDATHTIKLTAASGQSFQDNASVRTNALKYNVSNGVGVRRTADYGSVMVCSGVNNYLTVSRLQISKSSTGTGSSLFSDGNGSTNTLLKDIIGEQLGSAVSNASIFLGGTSAMAINVLVIARTSTDIPCFGSAAGAGVTFIGCTAVRSSDKTITGTGFMRLYGAPIAESCASFGFTNSFSATYSSSSKNNASSTTIPIGTSNQASVTYSSATPFTNAANSTLNLIPIAATSLAANGFLDATNAPNDISGTARSATPTIGVWELVATGGLFGGSSLDGLSTSGPKQFTRVS